MRNSGYVVVYQTFLPDDLAYVKQRPEGMAAFVRSLIEQDRESPADYSGPPRRTTLMNSGYVKASISLTMDQIEYCAGKPGGRTPFIRCLVSEFRKADAND